MDVHSRFVKAINHLGYSKNGSEFSRKVGIKRQSLYKIANNGSMPSLDFVSKIATIFNEQLNWNWVLTGEGSMLPNGINVTNSGSMGDVVGASKYTVMAEDLDFLREELKNKNQMIERLQKTNEQLSEKVTKLLEDKINYLQQK